MRGAIYVLSKGTEEISEIISRIQKIEGKRIDYADTPFENEKIPLSVTIKKIVPSTVQQTLFEKREHPKGFYWVDYEYHSDNYYLPGPLQDALKKKYSTWSVQSIPLILRENLFIVVAGNYLFLLGKRRASEYFIRSILEEYLEISGIPARLKIKGDLSYNDLRNTLKEEATLKRAMFEFKDSILVYIKKEATKSVGTTTILAKISEEYHQITGEFSMSTKALDVNLSYAFIYSRNPWRKESRQFKGLEPYMYSPNFPHNYAYERDPHRIVEIGMKMALISSGLSNLLTRLEEEKLLKIT